MTNLSSPEATLTKKWRESNILIVDDEPRVLTQLEQDLAFENFSICKTTSAEQGLKLLESEDIHIILCDQKMPGGMSGTEFLYQARKMRPYIIGMILSAFSESEYLLDAINKAKAFSYLLKPWDKEELIQKLKEAQYASYQSRIQHGDKQMFDLNLFEQNQQHQNELAQAHQMLDKTMRELRETKEALSEVNKANAED